MGYGRAIVPYTVQPDRPGPPGPGPGPSPNTARLFIVALTMVTCLCNCLNITAAEPGREDLGLLETQVRPDCWPFSPTYRAPATDVGKDFLSVQSCVAPAQAITIGPHQARVDTDPNRWISRGHRASTSATSPCYPQLGPN